MQSYCVLEVGFHGKQTEMEICMWGALWENEGSRTGLREKLGCDTVTTKTSARPGRLQLDGAKELFPTGAQGPGIYSPVLISHRWHGMEAAQGRRYDPR